MYRYETHLHTTPVSRCASPSGTVEASLEFYKRIGYDGVFITNHFLDGNVNVDKTLPYEEQIEFYFSDYERALELSKEIGIKVFLGVEISNNGTDFLVYGLNKEWFLAHPEIMTMKLYEKIDFMKEQGGLVIQAHPYRLLHIIQLLPYHIDGVEVINASRLEKENAMAKIFAENYDLPQSAGSDNHCGPNKTRLAGICTKEPIESEADFIAKFKNRETEIFCLPEENFYKDK